jgi:hypothetical protein
MIIHNPILTGSFTVNGTDVASITSSAASITAINSYTASQNILNGTYTLTSSFAAQTASFTAFTSSVNSFTASQLVLNGTYATTGSNTFKNPQTINSNLTVTGSITAQTLIVSTINATQSYSSGSNIFGNNIANTQTFTGSLLVTGSATFASSIQSNNTLDNYAFKISPTGSDLWGMYANISSSFVIRKIGTADYLTINPSGSVGIGTSNPTDILDVQKNQNATTNVYFRNTDNTNANSRMYLNLVAGNASAGIAVLAGGSGTGSLYIGGVTNGDIYFQPYLGGTVTMTLKSSGNVGIGTTTPTGKLDVASRGITVGSMPVGSVIQVVNLILSSGFSTTSASDGDTGLKASITPTSSTSKILVLVSANARATNSGGNCYVNMKLIRGPYDTGVSLHNGYAVMGNYNSTDIRGSVSYSYLDSPATTSSTQYVVSMNSTYAATVYMNSTTSPSTITLMEIAQ